MAGLHDTVTIVVGDSNPSLCDAIRDTFVDEGLTNVLTCATTDALVDAITDTFVDLIVIDQTLLGPQPQDLIQRIRRNAVTRNPFVAIVATISTNALSATKSVWDSGVDYVVVKPLTVDVLFARVSQLAKTRESFVVSARYIGPTRRQTGRPNERDVILHETPNSLRARLIEGVDNIEIEAMIAEAAAALGNDRFDATAQEIDLLVAGVADFYTNGGSQEDTRVKLRRLIGVAEVWRTDHDGPTKTIILDLSEMITVLAKRVLDTTLSSRVIEVDLLVQLSQAVRATTDIDSLDARSFAEITRIVAKFTHGG